MLYALAHKLHFLHPNLAINLCVICFDLSCGTLARMGASGGVRGDLRTVHHVLKEAVVLDHDH